MKKIIYKKSPLIEVVMQFKFPTILSINANDPIDFQEKIRYKYPGYQVSIEQQQQLSFPSVQGNNPLFPPILQSSRNKNYAFTTEDNKYRINLTSSFISIWTDSYIDWEDFISHFIYPLSSFIEIYKPAFFERIGLRYVNAYSRGRVNLGGTKWNELIQPHLLGAFAFNEEKNVISSDINIEFLLSNNISRAKVHVGLGHINNIPENVFVIDNDFVHIKNISPQDYRNIVEYLHTEASNFIKSAITPLLHEAMQPEELE